jgi:16S rRNA (adenine1518-N6/adenine1519-N6)-dimethyltransferase
MAEGRKRPTRPPALKRLGQHFLTDRGALARIADALEVTRDDVVVEIGPGRGALTDILVERAARVVAVEVDRQLIPWLRERYAGRPVTVVEGDVLELDVGALASGPYLLAGNVPYYITTPILFKSLEPPRPRRSVFLVQREVAERVIAEPGSKVYGALSVNVQGFALARIAGKVGAGSFSPRPSVESAILRVDPLVTPVVGEALEPAFRSLVQGAFGLRRKQMVRVMRTLYGMSAEGAVDTLRGVAIDPTARPETLSPADFARLVTRVGRAPSSGPPAV